MTDEERVSLEKSFQEIQNTYDTTLQKLANGPDETQSDAKTKEQSHKMDNRNPKIKVVTKA